MEVRFVREKTIHGLCTRTNNATEMNPQTGKIPGLWQTFDQTVPVDYKNGERVYGVYFQYESDYNGDFTVLAGFDGAQYPSTAQLTSITLQEGKYLVFKRQGNMPDIAIEAWTDVWNYFCEQNAVHQRLYTTDFEFYPSGNDIEVHIAIK